MKINLGVGSPVSAINSLPGQVARMEQVDKELEVDFWHTMVKEMAKTVSIDKKNGTVKEGYFQDLFYLEVAKELAGHFSFKTSK